MAEEGHTPGAGVRCGCGRSVEDGHRYCPACGSLVGHLVGDGVDPGAGALLLSPVAGAEPESTVVDEAVSAGRSPVARLAAVGSILVLGVLAWALFRQPSGEIAPDPSVDDEVALDDATTTTRPRTTRRARTTTTTESTTRLLIGPEGAPGLLLGEESGLSMAFGSPDVIGVRILDLDSGELRLLDGVRGQPIGLLGSSLVVGSVNGGVGLVDLSDPEAEEIRLTTGPEWSEVARIDDDRLWVFEDGPSGQQLVAYDEDGEEVERDEDPSPDAFAFRIFPGSAGGQVPDLVARPGGGLYRRAGDGFRRVAPGYSVAVGRRLALMQQCDEAMVCRYRWYDTETGDEIDHPQPPPEGADGAYLLVGGDRWLLFFDWREPEVRLFEVATADLVRNMSPDLMFGPFGPSVPLSDDGRWLIDRTPDGAVIVDLDDGTEWPIGEARMTAGMGAVLLGTVG